MLWSCDNGFKIYGVLVRLWGGGRGTGGNGWRHWKIVFGLYGKVV